ncbi:MAG: hypothetical protein M4579_000931 [Chaenotheca gracillima]|nr:MAG: hypothetical protein M4579_000931 [Chaenotheca gracillima]
MPSRPDTPRAPTAGPPTGPLPPFPLRVSGKVIKGFGRGSKELGIPTANIPVAGLSVGGHEDVESGVYFGWAGLVHDKSGGRTADVYPMVMSIGWNPFYKNTVRSVEVHLLTDFLEDFYGSHLNLLILGFIRPEYDYVDRDSLIDDIRTDIEVSKRSLEREAWSKERWQGSGDGWLLKEGSRSDGDTGEVGDKDVVV